MPSLEPFQCLGAWGISISHNIMNILTARGWAPQNLSTYLSPKIYGYELVQVLENKGLEEA